MTECLTGVERPSDRVTLYSGYDNGSHFKIGHCVPGQTDKECSVMILRVPRMAVPAAAAAVLLGVAACTGGQEPAAPDGAASGADVAQVTVVASTDVWASVVRAVAGDAVEVTALIDDPSVDPHAYESTAADAAAVTEADLVVYNGGGYDEFVEQILAQTPDKPQVEAFAVAQEEPHGHEAQNQGEDPHADEEPHSEEEPHADEAGHGHDHGENEHVWYDLPVAAHVAERVAEELGVLLPDQASRFTANAEQFETQIDELRDRVADIRAAHAGTRVAATEPVAFYLIEAAGLEDVTPAEFVDAVERETDPPAAAVAATRALLTDRVVSVLIYNSQTETPVTQQVRAEADAAGIPVVEMSETVPPGSDYVGWMSGQVDALAAALGGTN